ncbi:MAG: aminotransferase class V-fold PLP-dependent enzyme [Planctomycetota bacterium]
MKDEALAGVRRLFPALQADQGPGAPSAGAGPAPEVALDNAATTHKPQAVLDALVGFYRDHNANVHRAVHRRARAATELYEGARRRAARFLRAEPAELVFTRNATEAINLVARAFVEPRLRPDDVLVVTALEHHSNLVPWQQLCRRTGARLQILAVDEFGRLQMPEALPARTRFLAATRVSNAIGTIVNTTQLVDLAHRSGVPVLLDLAQAAGHLPLDEGSLQADFLVLSAHKLYGPTGLGLLRGRSEHLANMEPVSFGGEMVTGVRALDADWQPPPLRFEAGTPPIAEAIAFAPALDLIETLGLANIREHELGLLRAALQGLVNVTGLRLVGPKSAEERSGVISVALPAGDPQVAAAVLDAAGIAVRSGYHCAQPLLDALECGPTLRMSVALYTTQSDIDRLLAELPGAVAAARD